MSTPRTPSRRSSRLGRNDKDDGPRASLRQLLPFVFEQKGVLLVVAILSVLAAAFTLAQPLVVGQLIEGWDVLNAIKKGDQAANGAVEKPDYMSKVTIAP